MRTPKTSELQLVPMTIPLLRALADGRMADAERELGARIPTDWRLPEPVLRMRCMQLEREPSWAKWLLHAVVRESDRQLVGNVGFHGPPGQHPFEWSWPGVIELGYHTARDFRGRGYATQACAALLDRARTQAARHVILSIAPDNAASQRVAQKLGFAYAREYAHPERGIERLYLLRLVQERGVGDAPRARDDRTGHDER